MTAYQLLATMPAMTLDAGVTITAEAIDPATGATVTGVTITQMTPYGVNFAPDQGGPTDETPPLFVPIPVEEPEPAETVVP